MNLSSVLHVFCLDTSVEFHDTEILVSEYLPVLFENLAALRLLYDTDADRHFLTLN
jgi:hypothetical protein